MRNSEGNGTMLVGPSCRGFAVDADSILVSYGYVGDLDLDGTVDADDFARMDRGHLAARAGAPTRGYRDGDLDYDGDVDISHYFHIDRTHATQAAQLGVVPAAVALAISPRPALRPSLVEADPLY